MDSCYRIRGWDEDFENSRTRDIKVLTWVKLPIRLDSDGYTELLEHEDGAAHFGAWCAIVKVAARCDPRGYLLRGNRTAHDAKSLGRITRIKPTLIEKALPRLVSNGWLEAVAIPQEGAVVATGLPQAVTSPAAPYETRGDETEKIEETRIAAARNGKPGGQPGRSWDYGRSAEWDKSIEIAARLRLDGSARSRVASSRLDDLSLVKLLSDILGIRPPLKNPSAYIVKTLTEMEGAWK